MMHERFEPERSADALNGCRGMMIALLIAAAVACGGAAWLVFF
jgi:hypothetical protein